MVFSERIKTLSAHLCTNTESAEKNESASERFTDPSFYALQSQRKSNREGKPENSRFDVIIIGSGFSGIVAAIKLKRLGYKVRVYEKGTDLGGTWYWNRYPGAACDVPSVYYSYSFDERLQQEWVWPMKFSAQADIHNYARHVGKEFKVYEDIRFSTEVTSCNWVEDVREWNVKTSYGDSVSSDHLILAIGSLAVPQLPKACVNGGLDDFKGRVIHTARWPENADLKGKRIAVIGTGATAVQAVPELAKVASKLYVFQRTPATVTPRFNTPTTPEEDKQVKSIYKEKRERFENKQVEFWEMLNDKETNKMLLNQLKDSIRATVKDPEIAELLCPNYQFGCKRPCVHDDYYTSFNLENVELVDVSDGGLSQFNQNGPIFRGKEYSVDVIIFATGFDAMGGSNYKLCNVMSNGTRLDERWNEKGRPVALYGIHVHGFPNMYIMQGPHSPSVLSCMINSSEYQADHICSAVTACKAMRNGKGRIEVTEAAEEEWVRESERLGVDKIQSACLNWYNKDIGRGGLQIYTGSLLHYKEKMENDSKNGFKGTEYILN